MQTYKSQACLKMCYCRKLKDFGIKIFHIFVAGNLFTIKSLFGFRVYETIFRFNAACAG